MDNDRSSQPRRPFLENPYQMYVGTVTLVIGAAKAASDSHGKWIAGALILHILSILSAMSYDHVHAVAATRWWWTIILLSGTLCLYILLCLIFASEVFVKPMIWIGVMYLVYAAAFRFLYNLLLRYLPTSAQMASTDDIAVWMEEGRHRRED